MTPFNSGEQFGDTTYTKVFVGGLAWETKTDTMRKYFEQFGEILEAVVITEKSTGRSKGYGFVTFREPEAATRACVDGTPMIDGRRANCNLAAMGVQKSRPTTPKHGGGRNFRLIKSFQTSDHRQGGMGSALASPITFPHYVIQQGIPYTYGDSPYHGPYPMGYYNHGTASSSSAVAGAQYPILYEGASGIVIGNTSAFYPYDHIGNGSGTGVAAGYAQGNGYTMQYPHILQYSMMNPQSYAGLISLAPNTQSTGVAVALMSPTQASHQLTPHALRLIPAHFIQ